MILQREDRYRLVLSKICVISQAIKFSVLMCRCNSNANFRVVIDWKSPKKFLRNLASIKQDANPYPYTKIQSDTQVFADLLSVSSKISIVAPKNGIGVITDLTLFRCCDFEGEW